MKSFIELLAIMLLLVGCVEKKVNVETLSNIESPTLIVNDPDCFYYDCYLLKNQKEESLFKYHCELKANCTYSTRIQVTKFPMGFFFENKSCLELIKNRTFEGVRFLCA